MPSSRHRFIPRAVSSVAFDSQAGARAWRVATGRVASDLNGEPLAEDERVIVSGRRHPWAERTRISDRDLARARWVLPRVNTPTRMQFERAFTKRGLPPPNVVVETSDLAVLRGVLLNADLVASISPRRLSYELGVGLLIVPPVTLSETRRVIGITRRIDSLVSPGAKILMEEISGRCPAVFGSDGPLDRDSLSHEV